MYVSSNKAALEKATSKSESSKKSISDPIDVNVVPDSERQAITVYEAFLDGDTTKFRSTVVTPPAGVDAKVFAVNEVLGKLKFVPASARAKSVTVSKGIAHVDFPESIMAGYASMEEGLLVNSIAATLGSFGDIQGFQVMINGETIETLGHLDLSSPQKVQKPE